MVDLSRHFVEIQHYLTKCISLRFKVKSEKIFINLMIYWESTKISRDNSDGIYKIPPVLWRDVFTRETYDVPSGTLI